MKYLLEVILGVGVLIMEVATSVHDMVVLGCKYCICMYVYIDKTNVLDKMLFVRP